MTASSENREIIKTVASLASSLNLDIVAEGVETEDQLLQLRDLGCDFGQGFYFAPPLDAPAAEALIGFSRVSALGVLQPSDAIDAGAVIDSVEINQTPLRT